MPHNNRKTSRQGQTSPKKRKSRREPVSSSDSEDLLDIKKLQVDIRTWWRKAQKTRYKRIGRQYKSDRWIWTGAFLLIVFWLWFIAHSYHYDLDYYKCGDGTYHPAQQNQDSWCKNPFYDDSDWWKCMEEVPPGEYGNKPGPLFNTAWMVVLGILVLAGITNHVTHNRRRRS